jgi:flagellar basal body-associated protein FliL
MNIVKHWTLLLFSLVLLYSCPKPAREVAIDFAGKQASMERVSALVEAQLIREQLIEQSSSREDRLAREEFAQNAQIEVLSRLSAEERELYQQKMQEARSALSGLSQLLNPVNIAFFQDLPNIKGVTVDFPSHYFSVDLILAYDANDRRIGGDISNARLPIVDSVRNLLMQYPSSALMQGREELLREPIRQHINETLRNNGSLGSVTHIFITRFEVNEIPS